MGLTFKRTDLWRYSIAMVTVAIALLLSQWLLSPAQPSASILFFVAVAVSARYGGTGAGWLATVLAGFALHYGFDPLAGFGVGEAIAIVALGWIAWEIGEMQAQQGRSRGEEQNQTHRMQAIVDAVPLAICYVDLQQRYCFCNQTYREWFPSAPGEIRDRHLQEILGDRSYQRIQPQVNAALSGQHVSYETQFSPPEGGSRTVRATYVPDFGRRGNVKGFVALIEDITEEKQAAENLRQSEQRRQLAFDAANMGIWEWDLTSAKVTRSPVVDRIFGAKTGSFEGTYEEFVQDIHPEDRDRFIRTVGEAIERQTPYEIEFRIIQPNGEIRWVMSKGQVLPDEGGTSSRHIGVCMDITDNKYAQQALQVSQARFRHLFDSNLLGLAFGDGQDHITEANDAFLQIVGYSREDLRRGKVSWTQLIPPDSDRVAGTMQDNLSQAHCTPYEVELIHAQGQRVPVLMGRTPLEDYTNLAISFVLDVSERSCARAAIAEGEERLRLALEAAQMGMWDWDIATGTIAHSEIVDRLLGLEPGTFGGTYNSLIKIVHPDDRPRFNQAAIATMERGADFDIEFRVVKPNGEVSWLASICKRLPDNTKQSDRSIGVCMDITERKQIVAELHRREQEFTALADNAPDIIARMDREGRYTYINPAIETATGIPPERFIGHTFSELGFPPEIDALWQKRIRQVIETGRECIVENDLPTVHGTRHYQSRLVPERALDNSISYAICISRDLTELKQAEAALRETNQTLTALIQACPLAIMVLDIEGHVKIWNEGAQSIFGWGEAEVLDRRFPGIAPDGIEALRAQICATLAGNPLMGFETQYQNNQGRPIDVALWTAALHDGNDKLSCLCIVADIRDRKQAQEALRHSEERFRTLVNSMDDIVFTLDRQGRHTAVFGNWLERTQVSPEVFLNKTAREILGESAAGIHETATQKALTGEHVVYEWSFKSAIGEQHCQTSLSPLRDAEGKTIGVVGVGRDITDRYRTEQAQSFLAEASSVLASSLDYPTTLKSLANLAVPQMADYCMIYILEDGGEIRRLGMAHIDPAKEEMLRELDSRYPLDIGRSDPIAQVIDSGKSILQPEMSEGWLSEVSHDRHHLEILQQVGWNSCAIVPLVARGRTLGGICFVTGESGRRYDQKDLMLAEELARRAALAVDNARLYRDSQEANRMKDEFLAIVSHELRTPLNAMLGWAQLLRARKFDEATTDRALETIERNARAQTQLIEDLLDVSRILRGKVSLCLQPVALSQAIDAAIEAVRPAAEAKQIQIKTAIAPVVGVVSGDFNRLQQVIWNLLSNAIKFTPEEQSVEVRLQRSGAYAQLQVIDPGAGIQPAFLPFVFDRFRQADSTTTRSHGGLGLGLAIVRHLVELHGGRVRADSAGEGKGATFTVLLPQLEEESISPTSPVTSPSTLSLEGLQVLVVDDEPDTLEFLATVLQIAGATVTAVPSATEAIAAIEAQTPDVLISDIGMPEQDGYSLIRHVRNNATDGHELPALALTAYARDSDRTHSLDAGFDKHASKPIQPDDLIAEVQQLAARNRDGR